MATTVTGRAELEVREVQAMLRQAAMSFKASLSLFLTIALLLTAYKAAVRSVLSSDVVLRGRQSPSNSSSHSQPNAAGLKEPGTENSLRIESMSSDAEDSAGSQVAPPLVKRDVDVVTDEPKPVESAGSAQEDWAVRTEETQENEKQIHGSSISNGIRSFEARGHPSTSEGSLQANHEIGHTDSIGGDVARQHDEHGVLDLNVESVHEQLEEKDWVSVDDAEEQSLFGNMFGMEDTDASSGLPLLRIVMVSNKTGKSTEVNIENGLTYFTHDVWGKQRVDQDAMDNDGMASLVGLVRVAMLAFVFVVVEFPHAMVLGLVAYSIVSTHMGKRASRRRAAWAGLRSGIKGLLSLSFLHATWQVLQARILKETLFGGILGMMQVEQLCRRLSSLPFSILAPLRDEAVTDFTMAARIGVFLGLNQVCTSMAYCVYVVACWILVMERDQKVFGAIKRSCHLIRGMILQALVIQLVRAVMCGSTFHWLLQQAIGKFCTDFVMSVTKLYFLVLWFIFYLSARSVKDRPSHFSHRTLEDFLEQFN